MANELCMTSIGPSSLSYKIGWGPPTDHSIIKR